MSRIISGLLLLIAVTALPQAALAADAANGERLAKRWCAACHVVASDQKSGNTQVAPFSAIAKEPGIDAAKLALYLLLPHPKMPDMSLTRSEAADLTAYIVSQAR
jgi:mono/diheme cytochrome c family protein